MATLQERLKELQARVEREEKKKAAKKKLEDAKKELAALRSTKKK